MVQVVKHAVAVDTCASCGGIWLDKGELGELVAKMNQASSSIDQELSRAEPPKPDYGRQPYYDDGRARHDDHHHDHDRHDHKHRKRSIWDIFD